MASNGIAAVLTVKKKDLLERLEKRRKEVDDSFDAYVQRIDAEIAYRGSKQSMALTLADWHKSVAEGLANGRITVEPSGRVKGMPPKPKTGHAAQDEAFEWWSDDSLKHEKDTAEAQRQQTLAPFDNAIDMLNISTGSTVQINTADYNALLAGAVRIGRLGH